MKSASLRFLFMITTLCLVACKQEDPNPELKDPIYSDLQKRASEFKKGLEEEIKKQTDLKATLHKHEPNSLELKNAQRDLEASLKASLELDQKARYFDIRARRRLYEDRVAYREAFAKGEQWPNPREYSDYLVNMRLQAAPKNWGARVPKLRDRLPSSVSKSEKPK